MIRILSVFGTRPEAIKMAPVVRELERHSDRIIGRVCVTAQHRQMLDQVLELFGMMPDYDLNVMQESQSPTRVASTVLAGLEPILESERPDWVLVQGDTTTTMAASLAAFYSGARVGHIEAGLRSFDRHQPFPEEVNRRVASVAADMHFAPTSCARDNLLREDIAPDTILVTGNTVIDALLMAADLPYDPLVGPLSDVPWERDIVLVTAHRRENFGQPLERICLALRDIARKYPDRVHVIYPVHPNPNVQTAVRRILSNVPNITLTEPLDYLPLVYLMKHATLVMTDSGGIQEEAPGLGKPVLILRETTERPEGVEAGTARLVGTERGNIVDRASYLLDNEDEYRKMARAVNPYGDGKAASRIVGALLS